MAGDADVFGHALGDWARGRTDPEVIERADGFVDVGAGHELYLADFGRWPSSERQAVRYARGRVVDVGCGAGRVALHLQQRGLDVVALDASPRAVRTTRARGVRKTWCASLDTLTPEIGSFDTVVLFGNNVGIFGTPERMRRTLTDWAARTGPHARVLAQSTSPYSGGAPALDRGQLRHNRQRGLMPGQCRLRIRYRDLATPWFDWLFVSPSEMRMLLRGTGWHQGRILGGPARDPYVAVLQKD
jgi:SAM-dependent methyltransferase